MTTRDNCKSCGATSADKCVCGVHTCSYECERPACVRRQRDELRNTLYARDDKKEVMQSDANRQADCASGTVAPPGLSSDGPGVSKVAFPDRWMLNKIAVEKRKNGKWVDADDASAYAAARVAEATAELRTKLADAEASDAESMAMYRSARARADELQRRVAELEANDRRYRWLRDESNFSNRHAPAVVSCPLDESLKSILCDAELDSAIDDILADREGGKA